MSRTTVSDIPVDGDPKISGSFGGDCVEVAEDGYRHAQVDYLAALGKGRRAERCEEVDAKRQALTRAQENLLFARRAFG